MIGWQDIAGVEIVAHVDEPLVGDGLHPYQRCAASRAVEDELRVTCRAL
jgi:hypothetical protein